MKRLLPWFALRSVSGIGNHLFKRLIERFGSPQQVLQASFDDLVTVAGITPRLANAIQNHRLPEAVKTDVDLIEGRGIRIVTLTDAEYPPLLLQIPDPPPFLYVAGRLPPSAQCLAVVGSRHATSYGLSVTRRLCRDLAGLGMTIVSGMAVGIDTAAHEGALSADGLTIAVLGSGLANIYPRENARLAQRITTSGAVVSEFPMTADPEAFHFPIRNRLISGMSLGTVVVEASRKSGSLITAQLAADQGREVFAVPGSVRSYKSTGTHVLIKQGAKLVENIQDILDELGPVVQAPHRQAAVEKPTPSLTADERLVAAALEAYPVHIDQLARQLHMDAGKLSGILTRLELKGIAQQAPGMNFTVHPDFRSGRNGTGHRQKDDV